MLCIEQSNIMVVHKLGKRDLLVRIGPLICTWEASKPVSVAASVANCKVAVSTSNCWNCAGTLKISLAAGSVTFIRSRIGPDN